MFTNVPIEGAIVAVERVVNDLDENDLPVNKRDYIKLITLCVKFGAFTFNDNEYKQTRGLAMGSPLSPVMACLFMEMLEKDDFQRIIGRGCIWLRYVDDVLAVVPVNANVENKLRLLNNVNSNIQFTVEQEVDNKLPFLDTLIIRGVNDVKFKVYRKPTNRDDFIHYFSAHDERVKTGVVIGFFLRAYRICNGEFLEDELQYIINSFENLKFPNSMLIKLKEKAKIIYSRALDERQTNNSNGYVTLPMSPLTKPIDRCLKDTSISLAKISGLKIGDLVKHKNNNRGINESSVIYKIPCKSCSLCYIGETGRGIEKRLSEHKNDVRAHRTSNSIVVHIDEKDHLPDWQQTEILFKGADRKMRKTLEAAFIATNNTYNHREGFITLSSITSQLLVNEVNKRYRPPT